MSTQAHIITDKEIIAKHDPECRIRARIELEIIHKTIQVLTSAGFDLLVDDGGDVTRGSEQELVNAIFGVDEARLLTSKAKDGCKQSFVFFVLGNGGDDVICDYGASLEQALDPVFKFIDEQTEVGWPGPGVKNTYALTLTEEQAHAVGYAIRSKIAELKAKTDAHAKDLLRRLEESYSELDTCPDNNKAEKLSNSL